MASFLDNSGDIILDAVLTDYGRKLLAKGDGSFNVVKFAFGDDEIDYGLFDPNGTALTEDLNVMNTPILEAFTNNAASMKSQLLTIGMQNILYMPTIKLNISLSSLSQYFNGYIVPIDTTTYKTTDALSTKEVAGAFVRKDTTGILVGNTYVYVDQGIDSNETDPAKDLEKVNPMLYEREYNIYVDSKFCFVGDNNGGALAPLSIDDDGIAVYKFTEQSSATNTTQVTKISYDATKAVSEQVIAGLKGTRLKFTIVPNNNLTTDAYFNRYGKVITGLNPERADVDFNTLKMPVRVIGVTTGVSLEIPIMFAKVIVP